MKVTEFKLPDDGRWHNNSCLIRGDELPCAVCGRAIKKPKQVVGIHMGCGGSHALLEDSPFVGDNGDMGWHPVGPECAKLIPKEFLIKAIVEQ